MDHQSQAVVEISRKPAKLNSSWKYTFRFLEKSSNLFDRFEHFYAGRDVIGDEQTMKQRL